MGNKGMFRYADGVDKVLMLLGTLGSIGDGLQNPLTMFILSDVINAYGDPTSVLTKQDVDKVTFFSLISPYYSTYSSINRNSIEFFNATKM